MFKLVQNHKGLYFISLILIVSYSVVDLFSSGSIEIHLDELYI